MISYCKYAQTTNNHHKEHHDTEHGFPPKDDDDLFRRLMLEVSQAGLTFDMVLRRKKTIYNAFNSVNKVSKFKEEDFMRLMKDKGIIRNKLKIRAAIYNAKRIKELQKEFGSFKQWLDKYKGYSKDEWVKLFKKNFKFTGGEITNEFLMSAGYLPGAHDKDCVVGKKIR